MIIPIEKGFALVGAEEPASPRERFEKRAEEIALAAEHHVRRLIRDEADLLRGAGRSVEPGSWSVDPESRDAVPFGLKRRVVLRVPVFPAAAARPAQPAETAAELEQIRALMARLALDLIGQVIEINRYFAETGLVKAPEFDSTQDPERGSSGNTMSGGNAGSSRRRRA
jgi:hypothetical protein